MTRRVPGLNTNLEIIHLIMEKYSLFDVSVEGNIIKFSEQDPESTGLLHRSYDMKTGQFGN
jgi:hypothetical protein